MEVRGRLDLDSIEAVGHVIGVIAVFVGIAGLVLSVGLAEDFSIQQGALSDLGATDHELAWLFNGTLILAGALAAVFFASLIDRFDNRFQRIGTALNAVAGVLLLAVGVFPLGHALHAPVAIGFFLALSTGILITGYGDWQAGRPRRARVALNLVLLHALAWVFGIMMLEGIALPELVGALVYAIWVIILVVQRGRELTH